jgi:uncharacterized protein
LGRILRGLAGAAILAAANPLPAAEPQPVAPDHHLRPVVSLIIDDLGNDRPAGLEAMELPGAVTYSFLPRTPFAARLAELAHVLDKEVMLHLPMESVDSLPLGPGGLKPHLGHEAFVESVDRSIASIPHAAGVSNHMGSLLTRQRQPMTWLMQTIQQHSDLYFVDSRTTGASVAAQVAEDTGIPNATRDVFLDHEPSEAAVTAQFHRFLRRARLQGTALAIGHPYPATLAVLRKELPRLAEYGVRLVPVSALIAYQSELRLARHAAPEAAPNSGQRGPLSMAESLLEHSSHRH